MLASVSVPVGVIVADSCPDHLDKWLMNQSASADPSTNWIGYYIDCIGQNPFRNATEFAETEYAIIQAQIEEAINNNASQAIIDALKEAEKTIEDLLNDLDDLTSCNKTQAAWSNIKDDICVVMMYVSHSLFAFFACFCFVFCCF
jgi:hypothetical protein